MDGNDWTSQVAMLVAQIYCDFSRDYMAQVTGRVHMRCGMVHTEWPTDESVITKAYEILSPYVRCSMSRNEGGQLRTIWFSEKP